MTVFPVIPCGTVPRRTRSTSVVLLICILAAVFLAGCSDGESKTADGNLGIYLYQPGEAGDGNGLLAAEPVIGLDDIVSYDWVTHEIVLTDEAFQRIDELRPPTSGLSFAVCVEKSVIYTGAFWPMYSSQSCDGVVIQVCPVLAERENAVALTSVYPSEQFGSDDPRGSERIRQVLEQAGKLMD